MLARAHKIPDFHRRIVATIGLLALYRLGAHIPIPGVNSPRWEDVLSHYAGSIFEFVDLFAATDIHGLTIFTLGVVPYVVSVVLIERHTLLPRLNRARTEGHYGQAKISQWIRRLTFTLAILMALLLAVGLQSLGRGIVITPGFGFILLTTITLTSGATLLMWLMEQLNDRGIGTGMSLVILASILSRTLSAVERLWTGASDTFGLSGVQLALLLLGGLAVVSFMVMMELAERRIPMQYSKRIVGARAHTPKPTALPLPVTPTSMAPLVITFLILALPQTLASLPDVSETPRLAALFAAIRPGEPVYVFFAVVGIVFLTVAHRFATVGVATLADMTRKAGGYVPGMRPGRNTALYFGKILAAMALLGGISLGAIFLVVDTVFRGVKLQHLPPAALGKWIEVSFPRFVLDGLGLEFSFVGIGLVVVVRMALNVVRGIEGQLAIGRFEGFSRRHP